MNNQFSGRIVYEATEWIGTDSVTGAVVFMSTSGKDSEGRPRPIIFRVTPPHGFGLYPSAGSGLTLVAARAKAKRHLVGIEKELSMSRAGTAHLKRLKERREA